MFKEKRKVSIINKIMIAILTIISVFAIAIILLIQLNKKSVYTNIKETQEMIANYSTTEENTWDVSANGDGSVIATLSDDGILTISGEGNMKNWKRTYYSSDWHKNKGKVIKIVIEEGVTNIGDNAFEDCSRLTRISIPSSVTSIGDGAFYCADSLKKVNIPEGVTSIGDEAFRECTGLVSANIPSSVETVGNNAFNACSNLTNINISEGVTKIGDYAFLNCFNLKSINIPKGLNSIGKDVLGYGLIEIKVDENNTEYCDVDGVLYTKDKRELIRYPGSKTDETYTIPEGVINIKAVAFRDNQNLKSIEIPSSVINIEDEVFKWCNSLEQIKVNENNLQYMDDNGVLYTKDRTKLIKYPDLKKDVEYTILEGTLNIEKDAFYSNENIVNVKMPNSIISIGCDAFRFCRGLTSINFPEGLISIGDGAFCNCVNLISIDIPEGVTDIGDAAFNCCTVLRSINIPKKVINIGDNAFSSSRIIKLRKKGEKIEVPSILQRTKSKGDVLYSSREWALTNCTIEGNEIVINEDEEYAKITVKEGVLEGFIYIICNEWDISDNADGSVIAKLLDDGTLDISGTGKMKKWISERTPWDNIGIEKMIKRVNINNGITNIGESVFNDCNNIISIQIPSSVTSVSGIDFHCNILKEIKVDNDNTKYCDIDGVLYTKDKTEIIRYPQEKDNKEYKIAEEVTSIGPNAFRECENLTNIILPEGLTNIGDHAFTYCKNITNINMPDSVKNIGYEAFFGCKKLTNIKIPSSLTSIESGLFYKSGIVDINIPEGIKSIKSLAFVGCNITSITIPSSVKELSETAFMSCSILKEIKVDDNNEEYCDVDGVVYTKDMKKIIKYPEGKEDTTYTILEGVTQIGYEAFHECNNIRNIMIPNSVTDIEMYAFYKLKNLEKAVILYESCNITDKAFYYCFNLTIVCQRGSKAEKYARRESKDFQIDEEGPTIYMSANGEKKSAKEVSTIVTVEDKDSGVSEASLKYVWATQGENITEKQIVNSFQNGGKINIKDVTGTYYLWICAKDNFKNENIIMSDSFVLDNTAPIGQVTYTAEKRKNVKVTIMANEELQEVEGWTLSEDKKILTKKYILNMTETVMIKDIAGNETPIEITTKGIKDIFKEGTHEIKNHHVIKIPPKTTYESFAQSIETENEYKVVEDDNEIAKEILIKTGQNFIVDDQEFTLVVTGDSNGDGQANIKDIMAINKYRFNKGQLVNEYLQAVDVNEDGKVDIRDILRINKYRLGKISEF